MKEIGGYFGLEVFQGKEYHEGLLALNNGRNALLYLLKAKNIRKLYIPYFLCDSVSNLCDRYGYAYEYYNIDRKFMPVFEKELGIQEYLYVVNFYGQLSNDVVRRLRIKYKNVIFDNIHAFFQKPVEGVDTIYSCRKFFGVPDGGYLSTDAVLHEQLPKDISSDRMKHILGRFEGKASDFYADFKANDQSFATLELRGMSELTHNLLRGIDYEAVRQKRNKNYALLDSELKKINGIQLIKTDGPYAYPFYCKNGMEIKKKLAEHGVYVATLWPNVLESGADLEIDYAKNILPLPCDQRYISEDIQKIIRLITNLTERER